MSTAEILDFLGGEKVLGRCAPSSLGLIELSRKRLPKTVILRLEKRSGLDKAVLLRTLHLSERQFRRYKDSDLLSAEISERAVQVAKLFARGLEVFGDDDRFLAWLKSPCTALGETEPYLLLDTAEGISLVLDELIRIEHGVFY